MEQIESIMHQKRGILKDVYTLTEWAEDQITRILHQHLKFDEINALYGQIRARNDAIRNGCGFTDVELVMPKIKVDGYTFPTAYSVRSRLLNVSDSPFFTMKYVYSAVKSSVTKPQLNDCIVTQQPLVMELRAEVDVLLQALSSQLETLNQTEVKQWTEAERKLWSYLQWDLYYDYSDDIEVWRSGSAMHKKCRENIKQLFIDYPDEKDALMERLANFCNGRFGISFFYQP